MTKYIRKNLLPNVPYLFIMWFFLKLGTAYRMADGANIAMKIVGMMNTIGTALQDIAPGHNGFDWIVGIAGAVLFRLLIYTKVKNAKKYRRDVEYGSARWSA